MKILFTGAGTGGHFYPIIAVAEEIRRIAEEGHLIVPKFYYLAPDPYDKEALIENDIEFRATPAGKIRRYFSLLNFFDVFKTFAGLLKAVWQMYAIFPDVVFSKGGYASFPPLFAARIFGIPVVIHESDSAPGKVNLWAGKFAERVALSYPDAARYFKSEKVALIGNPVRRQMLTPQSSGAREFLKLEENVPVVLILGGSLGAQKINETVLEMLPQLLPKYQVIHQTGKAHYKDVTGTAGVILAGNQYADRYRPFPYLNALAMKMAAGVADLVVTRAGSALFEIAAWGLPSIVIPITDSNADHQRKNAFTYSHSGAAVVMEESNLAPHVLASDIIRLMENKDERAQMSIAAKAFARPDAAEKIARELLRIALAHEK